MSVEIDPYLPIDVLNYIPDCHLDQRINKDVSNPNANDTALIEFSKVQVYTSLTEEVFKIPQVILLLFELQ